MDCETNDCNREKMGCKGCFFSKKEKQNVIKGRRIIYNRAYNDWNDEPEYKLQKVRIYGESNSKKSYVIDSYGNKKFTCHKSNVFLNKEDMKNKIDNIQGFNLMQSEKEYLLNSW